MPQPLHEVYDLIAQFARKLGLDLKTFIVTVLCGITVYFAGKVRALVKQWLQKVADWVLDQLTAFVTPRLAAGLSLRRYCTLALANTGEYLRVPSRQEITLRTDEVFIPLTLDFSEGRQEIASHSNLMERGKRIRVVGDPGSGKSSLVKRLFRDTCREALRQPMTARLPILIELKRVPIPDDKKPTSDEDWLFTYIRERATSTNVFQIGECFDELVRMGGLIILLDGLDEVSTSQFGSMSRQIIRLSNKLHSMSDRHSIVLTMRTQMHTQIRGELSDSYPVIAQIKPFTLSDIYEFLTRWPFRSDRPQHIIEIFGTLSENQNLRDLCTNPLVFSMYVAYVLIAQSGGAPETRTDFYLQVTEELCYLRRKEQLRSTDSKVVRDQRFKIFGALAFKHLQDVSQAMNSIPWDDMVRVVCEVMHCKATDAYEMIHELSKETGLVTVQQDGGSLFFIHLTFCEFFAAHYAARAVKEGYKSVLLLPPPRKSTDIAPLIHQRFAECIPFMFGLLTPADHDDAFALLNENPNILMRLRCFSEARAFEQITFLETFELACEKVEQIASDSGTSELFSLMQQVLVQAREVKRGAPKPIALRVHGAVSELVLRLSASPETLIRLLTTYSKVDVAGMLRLTDLMGLRLVTDYPDVAISACDNPLFIKIAVERARNDSSDTYCWAIVLASAALPSRLIAEQLSELPFMPEWVSVAKRAPREYNWITGWATKHSLLTQVFTLASMFPGGPPNVQVATLKAVESPNRTALAQTWFGIVQFRMLTFTLMCMLPGLAVSALILLKMVKMAQVVLNFEFTMAIYVLGMVPALLFFVYSARQIRASLDQIAENDELARVVGITYAFQAYSGVHALFIKSRLIYILRAPISFNKWCGSMAMSPNGTQFDRTMFMEPPIEDG